MNGTLLRFYLHESQRVHHILLWEWLLQQANQMGIRGGSAFRAMAGFGNRHVLHEEHFFELAGTLTVEVEFSSPTRKQTACWTCCGRRVCARSTPAFRRASA